MILAIDFDGCLHDYLNPVEGRRMGAPVLGAKEAMAALHPDHTLIIHTVRGDSPQHIIDWCTYYQIPFHEVTALKPNADYYIDDKAVRFKDWNQTLNDIGLKGIIDGFH